MDLPSITARILPDLVIPPASWHKPTLIGIFGVPGTGKTEVARYLTHHHPLLLLSTDALRLRYGLESGLVTRQVMDQLAAYLLPQGISIILDGIHLARKDRQAVQELAHAHQTEVHLIYVTAAPEVIKQRLQARMQTPEQIVAQGKFVITPEHFTRIVSYLEPPAPDESVIVVDTSYDCLDEQLDPLNRQLRRKRLGL